MAVNDLNLPPSEVRDMTIGEINAVIWARTRDSKAQALENEKETLYQELMELRKDG